MRFKILRYKPGFIDPARFFSYTVSVREDTSILDALEKIRLTREPTLVYRHSCHHASCGTCACLINGTERLTCATMVSSIEGKTVTLEPLRGFERIADLAVDAGPVFQNISPEWNYLMPAEAIAENQQHPPGISFSRFENCIECGGCMSACPVSLEENGFLGPAALAALHREMLKLPDNEDTLRCLAGGSRGAIGCRRALACSRVCPATVYPARHIAELLRKLEP
jgi:succinate dehydrogenase / fumarate reductase iron-sulfur subunit